MSFLVRNIIFGVILIVLAYLFFANQDLLMSFGEDTSQSMPKATVEEIEVPPASTSKKPQVDNTGGNKAAKGLSKFYANINADTDVDEPTIRNNIVYLPTPKGDLELMLDERRDKVLPLDPSWEGTKESRPFRLGETIFQKLYEHAQNEKLKVFWRLNRDYVVKDAFRINKNILKTALQLGQGISGHFQHGVSIYFCYQSRSIVFIEGTKSYLNDRCTLLTRESNY